MGRDRAQRTCASLSNAVLYAAIDQWAFRCQRVGRGILLLAKDSAAAHPHLFSQMMPGSFVNAIWLKRGVWLACAFFAWKLWRWWGVAPLFVYGIFLGVWIDGISPWPSYQKILALIEDRISSGRAGIEVFGLLPVIEHLEGQMASGVHFEKATFGVWLGRGVEAAQRANLRDSALGKDAPPQSDPE